MGGPELAAHQTSKIGTAMVMPITLKEKATESLFLFAIALLRCRMLTHLSA
jgi:hypothetical protein